MDVLGLTVFDSFAHNVLLPQHGLHKDVKVRERESQGFRGLSSCGWTDEYQYDDAVDPQSCLNEIN